MSKARYAPGLVDLDATIERLDALATDLVPADRIAALVESAKRGDEQGARAIAKEIIEALLDTVASTIPSEVGDHARKIGGAPLGEVLEALGRVLEWRRWIDSSDDPQDPTDPLIGTTLAGRFKVLARIGEGGMGAVYRARQLSVDREVAIKVLHRVAGEEKSASRFEREAKAIAKLRHPNIVSVIDFSVAADRTFIAMELLLGEPLDKRLEAGPFNEAATRWMIGEACEALVEAHSQGVVHRDIKPSNLFLQPVGARDTLKIVDFGIARLAGDPGLTTEGVVLGTPNYLSPEQAAGKAVGPKSDIYSLGVVAYQCLTGKLPFDADNAVQMVLRHATAQPRPLTTTDPSLRISAELDSLIMSMLAKDPAARPTASELVERIHNPVPVSAPPSEKRAPRWPAIAAIGLVLAGLAYAALSTSDPVPTPSTPAVAPLPAEPPPPPPSTIEPPPPPPALPQTKPPPKLPDGFEDFEVR
jgi:serine/threonine-protein kinase